MKKLTPRVSGVALAAALTVVPTGSGHPLHHQPAWQLSPTGVDTRLRGLSPVSARVAWASGSGGVVLRTVDGGRNWQQVGPPGTADLQFRDIEAFDAEHATILAIGEGEASRIYRTSDGGAHWTLAFQNEDPAAFYDCMAFFDSRRGLALSDPVGGKFRILATRDGGRSWQVLPNDGMPPALDGEAGFAASGTCLVTAGPDAYFASGGPAARVFRSADGGRTWRVTATAVKASASAGIFSLAFRDPRNGLAIGGDYLVPDSATDNLALTRDGGRTWRLATGPNGYRSGAAWLTGPPAARVALAVGPSGSDISYDGGRTWTGFDTGSFDSVQCTHDGACWASGEQGRIARLVWS
jgi:photosystem II stability/assembly factor-like uncharacterized protein